MPEEVSTAQVSRAPANYSSLAFVQTHLGQFQAIWDILGWEWGSLFHAAARAVNEIAGPRHGVLNPDFYLSSTRREPVIGQLCDIGLFDGLKLEPGMWGDCLLKGAKYEAMVREAKALLTLLRQETAPGWEISFARMYGTYGQRPRTDQDDGTVEYIYANLTDEVKAHPWVIAQMELQERPDAHEQWHGAFATEFELGILALIVAANGDLEFRGFDGCEDTETLPGVPLREVESYTLWLPGSGMFTAINAPAVERPGKEPRPTSISTTRHWMERYGLQPADTVVVVTVRVHGRRMLGDIERQIHKVDPTVTVVGYCEEVNNPYEFFNQAMGEVAYLLQNAVAESLSTLRPSWAAQIDSKMVRRYLDELYASPTQETLAEILAEAAKA